jgi:hypothetical protein
MRKLEVELKKSLCRKRQANAASTLNHLDACRAEYANSGSQFDAAHCESKGYYQWMADFVREYPLVLEIGTGDGRATLELARRGHRIVSIDENPQCLRRAFDLLSSSEIRVDLEQREVIETVEQPNFYRLEYGQPRHRKPQNGVLLLAGDILADPELWGWLSEGEPFDAVVCWLIGTHSARPLNVAVSEYAVKSSGKYRLRVQNKTYKLADMVLRAGGVLHIVDRGELPSDENSEHLTQDKTNSHRDQAGVTSLEVDAQSAVFRPYEPTPGAPGIKLKMTLGKSGRDPGNVPFALWSIIARKP